MKNKRGISLIVLVITIIVMIIIAASVIISLSDSSIIDRANEAVRGFKDKQYDILSVLEYGDKYLDGYRGQPSKVINDQKVTGQNGTVVMPIVLTDTSKQYILKIESSLYNGEVPLNIYAYGDRFVGLAGVTNAGARPFDLRESLLIDDRVRSSESDVSYLSLIKDAGMAGLIYVTDGESVELLYDANDFGSEISIVEVKEMNRAYEGYSKLLSKLIQTGKLTADDAAETLRYCINKGSLGYNYLKEMAEDDEEAIDEKKEMAVMSNVLNNRMQEVADVMDVVTELVMRQGISAIGYAVNYWGLNTNDYYTLVNYFAENRYLNELLTRNIADVGVVFTVEFTDLILKDLNQDGVLGGEYTCANANNVEIMDDKSISGIAIRGFAAAYATIYPVLEKYGEDLEGMDPLEQYKFVEMYEYAEDIDGEQSSAKNNIISINTALWADANNAYEAYNMDTLYTKIYESGQKINTAGLKMGWNSIITPNSEAMSILARTTYDLRKDTNALTRQGVTSLANELYAYVESALASVNTEE